MVAIATPTPRPALLPVPRPPLSRPPLRLVRPELVGRRRGLEWSRSGLAWALAVLVAAAALVALIALPGIGTVASPAVESRVVEAGDTMWSIAVDHAPAGEAAGYVERLVAANGTATVRPGQVVVLPVP